MSPRPRLVTALFVIAVAALTWSLFLLVTGGFVTFIFGVEVRAHGARGPAVVGLVALAAFIAAHGARRTWTETVTNARAFNRWLERLTLPHRLLVLMMVLVTFVYAWRANPRVAGGSDSYGFLSQAQFWLNGVPIIEQPIMAEVPWPNGPLSFAPLGYRPVEGKPAIVPTYAPGLPLFLAGVERVAGYSAIFLTWPIAGVVLVLASYGLGRALGTPATGLIAAWLMATDLSLRASLPDPVSDVPVSAALAATCYFLFRAAGPAPLRAGIAAAIAVMIRPNLAAAAAVLGVWLALQPFFGARVTWTTALRRAALFAVVALPGFVAIALANRALYGSPFVSGYGGLQQIYRLNTLLPNLRAYSSLIVDARSELLFVGLIAVCLPLRRLWPEVKDRSVFAGIGLFIASVIGQYMVFELAVNMGFLRYLLPCWPLLFVGAAQMLRLLARPGWRAAAVGIVIVLLGIRSVLGGGPLSTFFADGRGERVYSQSGLILREHAKPNSVVLAMQHSGSVRFYSGLMTVRYDWIEPDWLDRAVDWFEARGVHVYALLDGWEVPIVRARFAGQTRAAAFAAPAFIYRGTSETNIFDISASPSDRAAPVTFVDTFTGPRITPPAPMQTLQLQAPPVRR